MISIVKNLFAPKVSAHIMLRGNIQGTTALTLQAIVQATNLQGVMRMRPGAFVQLDLEGPQPKIEALIEQFRKMNLGQGSLTLETSWGPFKNEYQGFRASM